MRGQLNAGVTTTLEPDRIGTTAARFDSNAPGAVDLIALGRASFPKMKKSIHSEPAAPCVGLEPACGTDVPACRLALRPIAQ
jgi:hypothetical protein